MRIEFTVETRSAETGNERNYAYAIELPDKTTLETVEAHVSNIARLLDRQASETLDDGDDDDDKDGADSWKGDKPKPSGPSSAAA
jgi:hypothetical protein